MLRESYREGDRVKNRTVANLSHCKPAEIAALRLALEHKDNLVDLGSIEESLRLQEGLSLGAVWTVYTVAKRLGIEKALGTERAGKLALWQVMARTLDPGSRLSAVGLAQAQAAYDVLGLAQGFDENDLKRGEHPFRESDLGTLRDQPLNDLAQIARGEELV